MSIWEKVVTIANKAMKTEAQQILEELQDVCPKRSGRTAASFHIMSEGSDATVSVGGKGLIRSVRIGSTLDSAYFADQGNGHRIIYPVKAKALRFDDGTFHNYARPYEGKHFVEEVANRHR